MPLGGVEMGDDLSTLQSQHEDEACILTSKKIFLRPECTEMRSSLLGVELTYSDVGKGWVREVGQGDSRLVEVGGLIGKWNRIVRIGSIARNITSKRDLKISCLFCPRRRISDQVFR